MAVAALRTPETDIDDRELAVRELGRRSLAGTFAHIVLYALGESLLSLHTWWGGAFTAIFAALMALRLVSYRLAGRAAIPFATRRALVTLGAIPINVVWGVAAAMVELRHGRDEQTVVMAFVICGVATGVVGALAPAKWTQRVSMLALLLPASTLGVVGVGSFWFASLHWLFLGFVLVQGTAANREFWEAVRAQRVMRAHNEALRREMDHRAQMEVELRQAQKLEAIGRLATGIVHEINTPLQFVGDSCEAMRGGIQDLDAAMHDYRGVIERLRDGRLAAADVDAELAAIDRARDLGFLRDDLPRATRSAMDGLRRVTAIVAATKQFAYPYRGTKAPADLNKAIESTIAISNHETKYVADVRTDLGSLPLVHCHGGEINQVFLNMIVNAAHAIGDVVAAGGKRGVITIRTRAAADSVQISISDDGPGIPPEVVDKIYEPFFTTKPCGKGTGQGLAIARSVVVDKHGGTLDLHTEPGRGTTFTIGLPVDPTGEDPRPTGEAGRAPTPRDSLSLISS